MNGHNSSDGEGKGRPGRPTIYDDLILHFSKVHPIGSLVHWSDFDSWLIKSHTAFMKERYGVTKIPPRDNKIEWTGWVRARDSIRSDMNKNCTNPRLRDEYGITLYQIVAYENNDDPYKVLSIEDAIKEMRQALKIKTISRTQQNGLERLVKALDPTEHSTATLRRFEKLREHLQIIGDQADFMVDKMVKEATRIGADAPKPVRRLTKK